MHGFFVTTHPKERGEDVGHVFRRRRRSKALLSPAAAKRRARQAEGSDISRSQGSERRTICHAPRPTPAEAAETASQRGPFRPVEAEPSGPPKALLDRYSTATRPAEDRDLRVLDPRRRNTTRDDGIGPIAPGDRSRFYIAAMD